MTDEYEDSQELVDDQTAKVTAIAEGLEVKYPGVIEKRTDPSGTEFGIVIVPQKEAFSKDRSAFVFVGPHILELQATWADYSRLEAGRLNKLNFNSVEWKGLMAPSLGVAGVPANEKVAVRKLDFDDGETRAYAKKHLQARFSQIKSNKEPGIQAGVQEILDDF